MKKRVVAITGASGSMGSEALRQIMVSDCRFDCVILLRDKPANRKLEKKLYKLYGERLKVVFGDVTVPEDCEKLVENADYVLHCAAIIPPFSDRNPELCDTINFRGTANLIDAIKASQREKAIRFVYIASVALYGDRNYKHMWGRVGDPLLASSYDYYAASKLKAERYLLDAELTNWVSLRQTAILHKNMLWYNLNDGLMFHTCWNGPLEWITDVDSGLLLKHLVEFDSRGALDKSFWNRCFNLGGGASCRCTGYETFDSFMGLMGSTAEKFFQPDYNIPRNFHGVWYYDSDEPDRYLDFRRESCEDFWKRLKRRYWYFKLGKAVPTGLLSKLVIQRLFKNPNSPKYWINHNETGKLCAFYGSKDAACKVPRSWSDYPLLNKGRSEEGEVDYVDLIDINKAGRYLLDHGYDESKKDADLDIEDMRSAAAFRGGRCLSQAMERGNLYAKLDWECHDGHKFSASPYTVLKAGHWCSECCQPPPWRFGLLAKTIPFFAQVWYDNHSPDEDYVFPMENVPVAVQETNPLIAFIKKVAAYEKYLVNLLFGDRKHS